MPNALPSAVAHPLAVMFHIFGQALDVSIELLGFDLRMNRYAILKHWRDLDHRFTDHHRDRIKVGPKSGQPKALGLKRD